MSKMCSTHLVLALVVLYVEVVHAWDIAVSLRNRLEFYTNGTETVTVNYKTRNLTAIAYNEVHNIMLFVDKQNDGDAICGYSFSSMDTRCFIKRTGSNIQDIAFDPATELLFFTDSKEGSINWFSLKDQESENNVYGNLLIKIDLPLSRNVRNIAVDSCKGYIYWTYTYNKDDYYMERARFNGSDREIVYKWLQIYSFAIDPKTHEYLFIQGTERLNTSYFEKADLREENLNGEKSKYIYFSYPNKFHYSVPTEITVSKDYVYWINSSVSHTTVLQKPKYGEPGEKPEIMIRFYNERPVAIAANYRIREQVEGLQDCEALSRLVPTITATDNSLNLEENKQKQHNTETDQTTEEQKTEVKLTCVHGIKLSNTSICKCIPGYTGEQCDVPACENYCIAGNCNYNDEGLPKCRCNAGYSGERCEVNKCHGYCLNNGGCILNDDDEPVCVCVGNYEGTRCEVVKNETLANATLKQYYSAKRNLTLADLLSNWRKPTTRISVIVEVQ